MSAAGPSRRRERVESTHEQDLLELFDHLSLEEVDEIQVELWDRIATGADLADHEVVLNVLIQQARELEMFNRDRMLAERLAIAEDSDEVEVEIREPATSRGKRGAKRERKKRKKREEAEQGKAALPGPTGNDDRKDIKGKGKEPSGAQSDRISSSEGHLDPSTNNTVINVPKINLPTGHDCVICLDPIYEVEIRAPCGHYYDIGCITDLFNSATRDESLFPPRCCKQNIPFTRVQRHLSKALVATFKEKEIEFSALKRVYCFSPACSRFLGPLSEGDLASKVYTCHAPGCGRHTCGKCRGQHSGDWGHVCRPDTDAAQILELSRASGWARCPGCSQMIELNIGCFHMTCRCRTEFCYLCHARWKTCACRQWDEWRLFAAAEERVDAQLGVGRERAVRPAPAVGGRARLNQHAPEFVPAQRAVNPAQVVRPAPVVAPPVRLHERPPPVFVPARHPLVTVEQQLETLADARPAGRKAHTPAATAPNVHPPTGAKSRKRKAKNASTPENVVPADQASTHHPVHPPAGRSHGQPANTASAPEGAVPAKRAPLTHPVVDVPAASSSHGRPANVTPTPKGSVRAKPAQSIPPPTPTHLPLGLSTRPSDDAAPTPEVPRPPQNVPTPGTRSAGRPLTVTSPNGRPASATPTLKGKLLAEPTQPVVRLPFASSSGGQPASTARTPAIPTRTLNSPLATSVSGHGDHSESTPDADAMRERMIRDMMERLREDHDCDHVQWHFRDGGGCCEHCGKYLPLYLFRCQGCEMLACNRCRRNRL